MTTRAQLRAMVRVRLEDTSATPLWSDAVLNDLIKQGMYSYAVVVPQRLSVGYSVSTGDSDLLLVPPMQSWMVRDVRGPDLEQVERIAVLDSAPDPADTTLPVYWSGWGDSLRFSRPIQSGEAGTYYLDYEATREVVDNDSAAMVIEPGHEAAVVALVAGLTLQRRAVEDTKRGVASAAAEIGATMLAEGMAALRRKRTARGGALRRS